MDMLHDDAYVKELTQELVQDAREDPRTAAALAVVDLAPVMPHMRRYVRFSRWLMSQWARVPDRKKKRSGEAPDST